MNAAPRILCLGHAAWDMIWPMVQFLEEDRKYQIPAIMESPGGPACNAAFLLARWGFVPVLEVALGDDPYGSAIIEEFRAEGGDASRLRLDSALHTPVSVVLVNGENGSRTILTHKNQNVPLEFSWQEDWPAPAVILCDGHETEAALQAAGRFPGVPMVLDGGSVRPGWEKLVAASTYSIVSERFAAQVLGLPRIFGEPEAMECLERLLATGTRHCAVTRGGKGLVYRSAGQDAASRMEAFPARVLDTTGAGDIFHGAFCAALLGCMPRARDPDLLKVDAPSCPAAAWEERKFFSEALRFASAAASVSVERRGGRDSIPSLKEVVARLESAPV